jgi:hypothetical protein
MATNTVSYLTTAVDIVLRFLPPGTQKRVALCVAIWLMGQCSVFVRNRELFAQEPFSIAADEPFTDELAELVTRLAIGGLLHASAAARSCARRCRLMALFCRSIALMSEITSRTTTSAAFTSRCHRAPAIRRRLQWLSASQIGCGPLAT